MVCCCIAVEFGARYELGVTGLIMIEDPYFAQLVSMGHYDIDRRTLGKNAASCGEVERIMLEELDEND